MPPKTDPSPRETSDDTTPTRPPTRSASDGTISHNSGHRKSGHLLGGYDGASLDLPAIPRPGEEGRRSGADPPEAEGQARRPQAGRQGEGQGRQGQREGEGQGQGRARAGPTGRPQAD